VLIALLGSYLRRLKKDDRPVPSCRVTARRCARKPSPSSTACARC